MRKCHPMLKSDRQKINRDDLPQHCRFLKHNDLVKFHFLKEQVSGSQKSGKKGVEALEERLKIIKNFVERSDKNSLERSVACGIFFFNDESILVNVGQLAYLLNQCKSYVNNYLNLTGYAVPEPDYVTSYKVDEAKQNLLNYKSRLKGWTTRVKVKENCNVLSIRKMNSTKDPSKQYVDRATPCLPELIYRNGLEMEEKSTQVDFYEWDA